MDCVERIFQLLQERGMGQKDFATAIGVSPQKVSEWKLGKAKSYIKYIPQIADVLETTSIYLLDGSGPKYGKEEIAGGETIFPPQESFDKLLDFAEEHAPLAIRSLRRHLEGDPKLLENVKVTTCSLRLSASILEHHEEYFVTSMIFKGRLGNQFLELYNQLNTEGQEKLIDYMDDMVRSGKYSKKSDQPGLGSKEA